MRRSTPVVAVAALLSFGCAGSQLSGCTGSSPAALAAQAAEHGGGTERLAAAEDEDSITTDSLGARARAALGSDARVEVVETWFVVVSSAPPELYRAGLGTIRRVYTALYVEYFTTPPSEPVAVYLFGDDDGYRRYVRKVWGHDPDTPYGFYRSDAREMVMNLATGTGTLAHELVHPLMARDFPAAPTWFNEGFASLFEQSQALPDGRMRGLVNWRLPGLQASLRDGTAVSLVELMSTTTQEFYGGHSGLYYAMARYLCFYLQEHALLVSFYRAFRDGVGDDATGVETLQAVVGSDLDTFEAGWRAWVLALEEP